MKKLSTTKLKNWIPDINWQINNFGKILIMTGIITAIGCLIIYLWR